MRDDTCVKCGPTKVEFAIESEDARVVKYCLSCNRDLDGVAILNEDHESVYNLLKNRCRTNERHP